MSFDPRAFAYASTTDVLRHLTFISTFSATSKPNATQVHSHLIGVSDELDGKLAQADYPVPIATGATLSSNLLRQWTSIGAAMHAAAAAPQGRDSKHLEFLERQFTAILHGIAERSLKLPDASVDSSLSLPRFGRAATGGSAYFTRDWADGV